jgi:PAS domain S-box-containing protein
MTRAAMAPPRGLLFYGSAVNLDGGHSAEAPFPPATVLAACAVIAVIALGLDLLTPRGLSVAILYIPAVLAGFWLPWRQAALALAAVASVLALLGYALSPGPVVWSEWVPLANRFLSIAALWVAAGLLVAHRSTTETLKGSESALDIRDQELREREALLRSILETAPEAIVTIDERGIVESFGSAAEALFVYSADEVVGRNVSMLMPSPYREQHDEYLSRYLSTGERRIIGIGRVVEAQRKDGSVFPIELAVGEAAVGGRRIFTGFIRDLTARQRMEQELRQAQKMEAVGQLTGGVAHDFNNLLTVIVGNLEMLEARLTDERQRDLLREAQETAQLGAQLTQRLLAFGRRQPLRPERVNLGRQVPETAEMLRRTLGETVELHVNVADDGAEVKVDPGQLQNALLNLAINARDAMPRGGRLTIEVENVELDADFATLHPGVRLGRYVMIAVTDTGTGMSAEVRERAFEPFFTSKEVGVGSGLGLSMVYGFVKQSGGHVDLYSELGLGTSVKMYLPRVSRVGAPEARQTSAELPEGKGETVLVVEDEERVRRVSVARLEQLGYSVLEAENGQAALAQLDRHPEIAVLFSDMVMPGGIGGAELVRLARDKRPDLKVILTSGYAEPKSFEGVREDTDWLRKPHTLAELARTMRKVLDT